jgi:hypothetical protein
MSIIELFWCLLLNKKHTYFEELIYDLNSVRCYGDTVDFTLTNTYVLYVNDYTGNDSSEQLCMEKAFDFLRAMKFAVDFKEDEYIKLID